MSSYYMCINPRSRGVFLFRLNGLQPEKTLFDWAEIQVRVFWQKGENGPQTRSYGGLRRLDGVRFQISENGSLEINMWK